MELLLKEAPSQEQELDEVVEQYRGLLERAVAFRAELGELRAPVKNLMADLETIEAALENELAYASGVEDPFV